MKSIILVLSLAAASVSVLAAPGNVNARHLHNGPGNGGLGDGGSNRDDLANRHLHNGPGNDGLGDGGSDGNIRARQQLGNGGIPTKGPKGHAVCLASGPNKDIALCCHPEVVRECYDHGATCSSPGPLMLPDDKDKARCASCYCDWNPQAPHLGPHNSYTSAHATGKPTPSSRPDHPEPTLSGKPHESGKHHHNATRTAHGSHHNEPTTAKPTHGSHTTSCTDTTFKTSTSHSSHHTIIWTSISLSVSGGEHRSTHTFRPTPSPLITTKDPSSYTYSSSGATEHGVPVPTGSSIPIVSSLQHAGQVPYDHATTITTTGGPISSGGIVPPGWSVSTEVAGPIPTGTN
ncbi:hypothetical protein QBC46DRAFT_399313 [Diplogelasinospora grovesii]|uniref:Uncharacterized protein n=1 Tax=Diplogelasinospora grovesii TaxID=303347 RepID=A0AAN6MY57_9PEZI|nr:hypothetical protein QBC46DRAFT_399313 [Diplogelasinospora grovesii]